jgi:hypothetical protein
MVAGDVVSEQLDYDIASSEILAEESFQPQAKVPMLTGGEVCPQHSHELVDTLAAPTAIALDASVHRLELVTALGTDVAAMALDALWAVLIPKVSGVSQVQAPIHAGLRDTPAARPKGSEVSGERCKVPVAVLIAGIDTPDTPLKELRYPAQPAWALACTPDTCETPEKINDQPQVAFDPATDPDRYCWPQSTAMNGGEIDLFAVRLHRFIDKGVSQIDAEALADKLVLRDRESDDSRLCLECANLGGNGGSSWRCVHEQGTGVAIRSRDSRLPADLVVQLQSCDGFVMPGTPKLSTESEASRQA